VPRLVAAEDVDTVVRGLVGVIDVDDGPSDEQLQVLDAIVVHLFERDDYDLTNTAPLGPDDTARGLARADTRRRFAELMFTLETCRHPLTDAQVASCERYADALGSSPEEVGVLRVAIDEGVARAAADFDRFFAGMVAARSEPRLRSRNLDPPHLDPELVETVQRFHELPEGSLGWCLADFYATHGFAVPGSEISPNTYLYFDHDNIHVISGIAPTGAGEIALGGFQLCMDDNPASTFAFFSPLVLHETGITALVDDIVAVGSTLARPYAAELLGSEMARGSRTTGDFAWIDHLALAPLALEEVRARFGVEPPPHPDDGHHIYW
jgi:hypothetical protein